MSCGRLPRHGQQISRNWPKTALLLKFFWLRSMAPAVPRKKTSIRAHLARQMHLLRSHRGLRSPPHRNFEVGPPITPVARSSAPDPCGQDRVLLSGQRPHFFLFFAVMRGFRPQTLDACGLGALLCGVPGGWISALRERYSVPVGPA